jgi:hypothetical protein
MAGTPQHFQAAVFSFFALSIGFKRMMKRRKSLFPATTVCTVRSGRSIFDIWTIPFKNYPPSQLFSSFLNKTIISKMLFLSRKKEKIIEQ